jgi:hypothetical protein
VTNKVLKLDFYVHSWSPFDRSGEYELAKAAAAAAAALVVAWLKEERARFVGRSLEVTFRFAPSERHHAFNSSYAIFC